jgi:hypothetical protein
MNTYVILRRNGWKTPADLEKAAGRSSRVGTQEMPDRVRWIRSYVTQEDDGNLGTVCVYQAISPEAVAEHARRAGLPCDAVIPVARTVVVNDDPAPAA